jgi:hypothetical protein
MAPDKVTVMNHHVDDAIDALRAAIADGSCGVCSDIIGKEIDNLVSFKDLSAKVSILTSTQEETGEHFAKGNADADTELATLSLTREYVEERRHVGLNGTSHTEIVRGHESEPVSSSERPSERGFGLITSVTDMWRDRVRVTDVLALGGSR